MEGSHGGEGIQASTRTLKMMQNASKHLAKIQKNRSEIFRLKTLRGHISATKVGDIKIQLPFWASFHNSYTSFLISFQPILLPQNGAGGLSEYILGHFILKF